MKLFVAAFLLLASAVNISIAAKPTGKESLIITSTPAPCQQSGCVKDDKTVRIQNITKQYAWINQYKPEAGKLAGVVIPGNLTETGATSERVESDGLLSTLQIPYFFGLGVNDYINNRATCTDCAIFGVMGLSGHIEKLKGKVGLYAGLGNVYFDFMQGEAGRTDGWAYRDGMGSLGYTVELGAQKNIYLIQLNAHVGGSADNVVLEKKMGIRNNLFKINPVAEWLANRLEYAAQYVDANPNSSPRTIVVSMNGASVDPKFVVDPEIVTLLNNYNVKFRFLGNNGSSPNCKTQDDVADNTKFYCLGFSTERELLELELDYDRQNFVVFHHKIEPDVRTKIYGGEFFPPVPLLATGDFYPQSKLIMFNHTGWYNYVAKVTHGEQILADSGEKVASTIFTVDVPKAISKVTVSHAYMPGTVEVLKDDRRKDLTATMICVATNGYFDRNSRESENKVVQSTIDTPINFCAYP